MPREVQARQHDVRSSRAAREVAGHEVGVVAARGDEAVDVPACSRIRPRQLRLVRLRQRLGEDVVALKRARGPGAGWCRLNSGTMPESRALVRLMTSGLSSSASQRTSLAISFFCLPCSPWSIETVSAAEVARPACSRRSATPSAAARRKSSRRSRSHGVWRNSQNFCCEIDVDAAEEDVASG